MPGSKGNLYGEAGFLALHEALDLVGAQWEPGERPSFRCPNPLCLCGIRTLRIVRW